MKLFISLLSILIWPSFSQDLETPKPRFNISLKFKFSKEIPSRIRKTIQKDFYEILISTKRFDFSLGKQTLGDSIQFNGLFYPSTEKKPYYEILFTLRGPDGKLINKSLDKIVIFEKLPIEARELFLKLFLGQYFDYEKNQIISPKLSPRLEKKIREAVKQPPKASDLPVSPPVEPVEEIIEEGLVVKNNKEEVEKPKKKPKKEKKNSPEIADYEASPDIDIAKDYPSDRFGVKSGKYISKSVLRLGQENEVVSTVSEAEVETNTARLVLGISGEVGLEEDWRYFYYHGELGMITGEHEYGFGPKFNIALGYYARPGQPYLSAGGLLEIGSFNFAGLPSRGSGVQKSSHSGIMAGFGLRLTVPQLVKGAELNARYLSALITSASFGDLESVATTGSKIEFDGLVTIWAGLGLGFRAQTVEIISSNISGDISEFSITDTSATIYATYRF